jgi:hypothetical protein
MDYGDVSAPIQRDIAAKVAHGAGVRLDGKYMAGVSHKLGGKQSQAANIGSNIHKNVTGPQMLLQYLLLILIEIRITPHGGRSGAGIKTQVVAAGGVKRKQRR